MYYIILITTAFVNLFQNFPRYFLEFGEPWDIFLHKQLHINHRHPCLKWLSLLSWTSELTRTILRFSSELLKN